MGGGGVVVVLCGRRVGVVVVVVLVMGLGGFAKGSGWAAQNSNRLMRYRLGAQFVAVVLIALFVWLRGQGG